MIFCTKGKMKSMNEKFHERISISNYTNRSFSIKNIEHLKERGLISSPTYNIPNHIYFYLQGKHIKKKEE